MRNIIKQVLKEEFDSKSERVKSMVNKYGINRSIELVVGGMDTIKQVYQDNPESYLDQFNDLIPVEKDDIIYYVDKDNMPLFQILNMENRFIYISNKRIWLFFEEVIGLDYDEIAYFITKWLEEVYGIKGFIPLQLNMTVPII